MIDDFDGLIFSSKGKPWMNLLNDYLKNISLFINDETLFDYASSHGESVRKLTQQMQKSIKSNSEQQVYDSVDFWGKTCFDWFRERWLLSQDAQANIENHEDRLTWNNKEKYDWE